MRHPQIPPYPATYSRSASRVRPSIVFPEPLGGGIICRHHRRGITRRLGGRAELLERESGGGAVLTGPWLVSASVVLPHEHAWVCNGLIDSYGRLGQLHELALTELGVSARALPPQELQHSNGPSGFRVVDWACFGSLSPWEVVNAEGRKLVGLAQRRRKAGVLLVAGALIGAVDWSLLCDLTGHPEDKQRLHQCTVSVEEIIGSRIRVEQFAGNLKQSLETTLAASSIS